MKRLVAECGVLFLSRDYEAKLKAEKEQNGPNGLSDIEGKAVRVAARECGKRPSFKAPRLGSAVLIRRSCSRAADLVSNR
jgi:hypothetical protein